MYMWMIRNGMGEVMELDRFDLPRSVGYVL